MAGWKRLAKATADGTSSTLSVSFTATDSFKLQVYGQNTSGAGNFQIRFNNDTNANRHKTRRVYDGAGTSSNRYDDYSDTKFISNSTSNALQSYMIIDVHNIDNEEHLVMGNSVESGATGAGSSGRPHTVNWMGKYTQKTPQVTSVQLITSSNNLNDKSYIVVLATSDDVLIDEKTTLTNIPVNTRYEETDTRKIYRSYAVTNTPTPDTTTSSGNTILKFTDAGSYTFTPSANFNVEYLVVAGGAGGGNENWDAGSGAGGGGAGAYRTATGFSVTSGTSYTVTVGDGGIGGIYKSGGSSSCGTSYEPYLYQGTKGEDSVFGSITSNGGAGGGGHDTAGGNGCETSYGFLENGNASGGGGSNSRSDVAGNTTKGAYGYEGGDGAGSGSNFSGGGGGGSSQLGQDASGGTGGAGGNGTASSITGTSVTYATGGGGHGSSGNGTGGSSNASSNAGVTGSAGNSATSNTGSGGGANSGTNRAGKGGSGIVVLKFSTSGNTFTTNGSMGWKERGSA